MAFIAWMITSRPLALQCNSRTTKVRPECFPCEADVSKRARLFSTLAKFSSVIHVSRNRQYTFWDSAPVSVSSLSSSPDQQYPDGDQSKQLDASRIRSRIPPNMPKLLIPSTVPQFPPEITVTPADSHPSLSQGQHI
ncbi:hypothetical protein SKAU_G00006930 [Synaphobranchus kaupii]|uniref:Uncharacterized protein n=1 Tax=Synaphobranchus kaupii TaxID=118154 RepID=A0A9Q1GAB1_SYNKA|nr:hypothetical protein SKAU_G00006930 [Synaphobranchus kaupii]